MKTSIFWYCSIVFSLGVISTYAGYCGRNQPNCCLEKGIGKRSCNGSGTSDVSDLFGWLYAGKPSYAVIGKPNDVYRVWGVDIDFQAGVQSLASFSGIYAFFFQVPRCTCPNNTEFSYYSLEMGRCPKLIPINGCNSRRYVAGTSLSYQKVLKIVQFNNVPYFPAPCQVFQGFDQPYDSNEDVALNTRRSISVSGLSCIRVTAEKPCYKAYPDSLINQYGLYVTRGVNGSDGMYCQDGYPNGPDYSCVDPAVSRPGVGFALRQIEYDFSKANEPGQVCLLSQYIARFFGYYPILHFNFVIFTFVTPTDPYFTTIYTNLQGDDDFPTFRGLYSAAC